MIYCDSLVLCKHESRPPYPAKATKNLTLLGEYDEFQTMCFLKEKLKVKNGTKLFGREVRSYSK